MKEIRKVLNSKVLLISLSILTVILLVAGVTYAWFVWNSTDNTNITMTIGEYTVVTFTNGNNITGDMYPVYNYTDSTTKTTFTLNNSYSNPGKVMMLHPYLDITSLPTELKSASFKYLIEDANHNIKAEGDFSTYNQGGTIAIEPFTLPGGETNYTFYIYLDGTVESDPSMIGKTFTGTLRVEAVSEEIPVNPITDYEYTLFDKENTGLDKDYVLLTKYIGSSTSVVVPNTYDIINNTYDVVLYIYFQYPSSSSNKTTFMDNKTITNVLLPTNYLVSSSTATLNLSSTNMQILFWGCISLTSVLNIPSTVTTMANTFTYCTNLVNVPDIPSSVTDMSNTFNNCTSLVNAPDIPSSVTNMTGTFINCTNLVNAPTIPNGVTNMTQTFNNCTNLTQAPEIPNSVTNMTSTFKGCSSLTGTVRIEAANVACGWSSSYATTSHPFYGTVNNLTVEVPAGSTTLSSINNRKPANVTVTTFTP